MYKIITNSFINSLSALHATFWSFLHAILTGYSNGFKLGWSNTNELPKRFSLIHNGKNRQMTSILVLTFYLWFETKIFQGVIPLTWNQNFARVTPLRSLCLLGQHNSQLFPITQYSFILFSVWGLPLDEGGLISPSPSFSYLVFRKI